MQVKDKLSPVDAACPVCGREYQRTGFFQATPALYWCTPCGGIFDRNDRLYSPADIDFTGLIDSEGLHLTSLKNGVFIKKDRLMTGPDSNKSLMEQFRHRLKKAKETCDIASEEYEKALKSGPRIALGSLAISLDVDGTLRFYDSYTEQEFSLNTVDAHSLVDFFLTSYGHRIK